MSLIRLLSTFGTITSQECRDAAEMDAATDGSNDIFQAYKLSLGVYADKVRADLNSAIDQNFEYVRNIASKAQNVISDVPEDTEAIRNNCQINANQNLREAGAYHSQGLMSNWREMKAWGTRYPHLREKLEIYPKKNMFSFGGLIIFLIAIESVLNARFFSEEGGLIGGTLLAVQISFVNILFAVSLSMLAKVAWRNYGLMYKLSYGLISVSLVWAVCFNYWVVSYREEFVVTAPSDFENFLLWVLGFGLASFAFWKGWRFIDTYAGARKCDENIKEQESAFMKRILSPIDDKINSFQAMEQELSTMPGEAAMQYQTFQDVLLPLLAQSAIDNTNSMWAAYHRLYCLHKVDPVPDLLTLTLADAESWNVHIGSEWNDFTSNTNRVVQNLRIEADQSKQRIRLLANSFIGLKKRFSDVVNAKLLQYKHEAYAER